MATTVQVSNLAAGRLICCRMFIQAFAKRLIYKSVSYSRKLWSSYLMRSNVRNIPLHLQIQPIQYPQSLFPECPESRRFTYLALPQLGVQAVTRNHQVLAQPLKEEVRKLRNDEETKIHPAAPRQQRSVPIEIVEKVVKPLWILEQIPASLALSLDVLHRRKCIFFDLRFLREETGELQHRLWLHGQTGFFEDHLAHGYGVDLSCTCSALLSGLLLNKMRHPPNPLSVPGKHTAPHLVGHVRGNFALEVAGSARDNGQKLRVAAPNQFVGVGEAGSRDSLGEERAHEVATSNIVIRQVGAVGLMKVEVNLNHGTV